MGRVGHAKHRCSAKEGRENGKGSHINATAMCKVAGRDSNHYRSNSYTKEFIKQLKADTGIPISELIQTVR
ncbi:MAG: KilA-N domain-containing protein [Magnetococcales bacterium]|nr:KilA-N domain-containing protein [Magnetococcales bacterium]